MSVAIVLSAEGQLPDLFVEDTTEMLLARLQGLAEAPAISDIHAARLWLTGLPEPSGWFNTVPEALAYTERLKRQARAGAEEVATARQTLRLSRADFAACLGIGGNPNTRHKFNFEVENGQKKLSAPATRIMHALLIETVLSPE
ncbi:hypothetical protein [Mameliella alba]|uniref:hypothetical protein n=1 Tax=Mameliella alba TaxID=561184 RepID=UPI000B5375E8|nr:hypothetical protein [Mameliella alba]OWV45398.1 hypothetical protein CDZ95_00010 [Mameliella alba]OWV65870.1 hypothetical protein CDZ97_08420 [Mameliella alba]